MKSSSILQLQIKFINKKIIFYDGMVYSSRDKIRLQKVLCPTCHSKVSNWDGDVYNAWLRYLEGEDRTTINRGTHFSNFESLKHQFRKHPCHVKISKLRKTFKRVKTCVQMPLSNYPWLLGLYFADGYIRNKSQLAFALSMHEKLIEKRVCTELQEILGKNAHIVRELIGNMRQVRTHSIELCDKFPKKNEEAFLHLWENFAENQNLEFIAGFIDGDGSCSFDVGINSIQIYSKDLPFLINLFKDVLKKFGNISVLSNGHKLYLSPNVGLMLKPFLVKRDVKRPYHGSVDVERAYDLLSKGTSIYRISKMQNMSKKAVHLALKQVYGIDKIKQFTDLTKMKRQKL